MRIALFCNDYWPTIGGVQTAVRGLAQALVHRGHEPLILTCRPRDCAPTDQLDEIPIRRFDWSLRPPVTFPSRAWRVRRQVREVVLGWRPDVIYVHFVTVPALFARDCAPIANAPLILSFRGAEVLQLAPRDPATRYVFSRLSAAADVNLFCSPWLEGIGRTSSWFRGRPGRIGVLPDAVTVERRDPPDVPAGAAYVFAGGRMVWKKGFDLLLRAWACLGSRINAPLWIAGDGEQRGGLERLAADLALGDRVRFLGSLPHAQMLGLLERAALCVVPSREEPYGIMVVEAQALGVPCVAAVVGNLPALVEDGRTGYLAEPDADGLTRAIVRAWEDPRRSEVGQAGREAPGAKRDYRTMAAELERWIAVARAGVPERANAWT